MAAGEERDQGFLDYPGLAIDDAADAVPGGGDITPQLIYGVDKLV